MRRLDRCDYMTRFRDSTWMDELPMSLKSKNRLRRAWRRLRDVGVPMAIFALTACGSGAVGHWIGVQQTKAFYQSAREDAQIDALRRLEGQGDQTAQKLDETAQKLEQTATQVEGLASQVEATADKASEAAATAGTAATRANAAATKAQQAVQRPPPPVRVVTVPVPVPTPMPQNTGGSPAKPPPAKPFPKPWDSPIHKGLPP